MTAADSDQQGWVQWPSASLRVSPGSTLFLVICKQNHLGCISRLHCKQPLTKLRAGKIGGKWGDLLHPVQKDKAGKGWMESEWKWPPREACFLQGRVGSGTRGHLPNRQQE